MISGATPSRRSLHGLDWFAFFMADIQTGWGPFVAAYLTSVAWSQGDIGLILTIGTLSALLLQIPAGALVDIVPAKRLLAATGIACVSGSALLLALWPTFPITVAAKLLHAAASCLLGPALAAISLGLVGHALLSERLGRNARFLSLGNAIAAGVMGVTAYYFSNQAIFFLTAALFIPTLIALLHIRPNEIDPVLARGGLRRDHTPVSHSALRSLLGNRPLIIFAGAILLFQFANAATMPIMAGLLTTNRPETATLILAICILAPQFVVAAIAPFVGREAQIRGRRPLLVFCFLALTMRCTVFALTNEPAWVVAAQLLDGISAATLGVLVPLVTADVMRGTGHYNLAQGAVGAAVGLGASLSTAMAGHIADASGASAAFLALAAIACTGLILALAAMPETRPAEVR
jgi:MFS family permease